MKLCLDIGHRNNALDYGATNGNAKESELALQIGLKLEKQLQGQCNVIMTRKSENDIIDLAYRAKVANKNNCNLFVSIHINSYTDPQANGVEVWHYKGASNQVLAKKVCDSICKYTGAKNRGAKEGTFQVLRETSMTAILIECGFISNPDEVKKLQDNKYQDLIVRGIVEGLGFIYKEEKKEEQNKQEGTVYYRVIVSSLTNKEYAEKLTNELKQKGYKDTFIEIFVKK